MLTIAKLYGDRVIALRTPRVAAGRSRAAGYTEGMKTAISIPDDVYAEAEQLARSRRKSRSQLYAEAVREYLARHDADAITDTVIRVCEVLDGGIDPAVSAAGQRLLARVEW